MATKYVSQTATNGYVVGNDANDGLSKLTPWLTADKVETSALSGDIITFNDGSYINTGVHTIGVSMTLQAENPLSVTIGSANAIRQILLSAAAGDIVVILKDLIINGLGTTQNCIAHAATANNYNITLDGVKLTGATQDLYLGDSVTDIDFTATNMYLDGSPSRSGISLRNITSGSVDIDGITVSMTNQTTDLRGVISVIADVVGVTASIKNVNGSMSLNAIANQHYGIHVTNIPNVLIDLCDLSITGGTGTASALNYAIDSVGLDASGGVISNHKGVNSAPGGILALIGIDSSEPAHVAKNKCNGGKIFGADMTATENYGVRGYFFGNSTGGEIYNNKASGVFSLVIFKGDTGSTAHHNIGIDINGSALRAKGCTASKFYNNTYISAGGNGEVADLDTDSGVISTGVEFKNNINYFTGTADKLASVDATSDATFANNQYFSEVALPALPFTYQGTTYATFELWQAAQELTAQYGDPLFKNISIGLLKLNNNSPCIDTGVDVGLAHDFEGQVIPVGIAPDRGSFEFTLKTLVNGSCPVGNLFSGINNRKGNVSGNLKG